MKFSSFKVICILLLIRLSEQRRKKPKFMEQRKCQRQLKICENEEEIIRILREKLTKAARTAITANGVFLIGLSGGSWVNLLAKTLPKIETEWKKWRFFFCDERLVPFKDSESTFGAYKEAFSKVLKLEDRQFIVANTTLEPRDAAADYFRKMLDWFFPHDLPRFDTLLLGMGPDGHTCSLFPGHATVNSPNWVTFEDHSPKPPPNRITLTFPIINNAKLVIFVITGESKAEVVQSIVEEKPMRDLLPAEIVNPSDGELIWILDKPAASKLTK